MERSGTPGNEPLKIYEARGAADSIKPGVERSGTPGNEPLKIDEARGAGDSRIIRKDVLVIATRYRPLPGLCKIF
jgi:hypothetical protein